MESKKGFRIDLCGDAKRLWMFNISLLCSCRNSANEQVDVATTTDTIAAVGSPLKSAPKGCSGQRTVYLQTTDCHHIELFIEIVPHTLPTQKIIAKVDNEEMELSVIHNGKKLSTQTISINPWGGYSMKMKFDE